MSCSGSCAGWPRTGGKGMTEQEWLGSSDPQELIRHRARSTSDRQLRLIQVGCARRLWPLLVDQRSRDAILVAERFADGQVTERQVGEAYSAAVAASEELTTASWRQINSVTLPEGVVHFSW